MKNEKLIKALVQKEDSQLRMDAALCIQSDAYYDETILNALVEGLNDDNKGVVDVFSRVLSSIPEEYIDTTASFLVSNIKSQDISLRNLSGDILVKLGISSTKYLLPYLRDEDCDVRKFACDLIGLVANSDYSSYIVPLIDDSDSNVVASAIDAIGNFQDESQLVKLNSLLNELPELKPNLIEAIGKIGTKEAQIILVERLKYEKDLFNKTTIIDSLALSCDDEEVANLLLKELETATLEVQLVILKAIMAIYQRIGEEIEFPAKYRKLSYKAMKDDDPEIRAAGLVSLGNKYSTEDIDALCFEVMSNNPETQEYILYNILNYCDSNFIEKFFNKYCTFSSDLSPINCDIDFLSQLTNIWVDSLPENQKSIVYYLTKYIMEKSLLDMSPILDLLLALDREMVEESIKMHLNEKHFGNSTAVIEYLKENGIEL